MTKTRMGGGRALLALLLAVCLLAMPLLSGSAFAVDLTEPCLVTVKAAEDAFDGDLDNAHVVVDYYLVASAAEIPGVDSYTFRLTDAYSGASPALEIPEEGNAQVWQDLASKAASIALDRDTAVLTGQSLGAEVTLPQAGLYLLAPHGTELDGQSLETYVDEESGNFLAYSDSYIYSFEPILLALPSKPAGEDGVIRTDAPGDWIFSREVSLKVNQQPRFGSLEIVKTLSSYDTLGGAVSFVFEISYEQGGETVTRYRQLTFDAPGQKTILFDKEIPVGAEITVTEVESGGSYRLVSGPEGPVTIDATEVAQAEFENEYDRTTRHGLAITNNFTYETNWRWIQLED